MAIIATGRQQVGTSKTWRVSGGDYAFTFASLANTNDTTTGYRQGAKGDLGATFAGRWLPELSVEMAATPTAGNVWELWWAPSVSATAGTSNPGNVSGTDLAYSGYSSNNLASVVQLIFVGYFRLTAQATATVQVMVCTGELHPPLRYGSPVVVNRGGSAHHTGETNSFLRLTPIEDTQEA